MDAVLQDILMHQHDFPFLAAPASIFPQPAQLLCHKARLERLSFVPLAVEHHEMHIAIVKGIIVAGKIPAVVFRHHEIMKIGLWQPHLPILVISFMIAHQGHKGNAVNHAIHAMKPGLPLRMVFAIVHDIAHIDKECRLRIALGGILR